MTSRIELLGVRIKGPDVLSRVEVPLVPGLNALVGLNGAGKTRVLSAVGRALSGQGSPGFTTHVLLRAVEGDHDSRTASFAPKLIIPEDTAAANGTDSLDTRLRDALSDVWVRYLRRLQHDVLAWSDLPEADRVQFEHFSPEDAADEDPAIASLSACGYLAWVQEGITKPRLWVAASVPTEEPHADLIAGLHAAWKKAEAEFDEQDPWHPDGIQPVSYQHFDLDLTFVPGETSPTASDFLPIPLVPLRERADVGSWPAVLFEGEDGSTARDLLAESLTSEDDWSWIMLGSFMEGVSEEEPDVDPDLMAIRTTLAEVHGVPSGWEPRSLEAWSRTATEIYRMLYPQATELRCRLRPVRYWTSRDRLAWHALDHATRRWVHLDDLSSSARRWAQLATFVATSETVELGSVALFDEPERGLHRLAELQLALALQRIPRVTHTSLLVATHSPLLAAAADRLVEVSRSANGGVVTRVVDGDFFARVEVLGMLPQDVLSTARQVLLVEGPHDRRVVEGLLAETLRDTRTLIVPFAGVAGAGAAVNADLLVRYGPRRLIVMVDALGHDAEAIWARAGEHARRGDVQTAREVIEQLGKKTAEMKFLRTAAHELLEANRLGDCEVVALSVPDVLDLLPPGPFVRRRSWMELREEYERADRGASFKEWAAKAFNAKFDVERIDQAVALMDHIPEDLTRLDEALRRGE